MDQNTRLFREIFDEIRKAERILVVADGQPDGDAVGSSSAMHEWLCRIGKKPQLFCPAPMPRALKFLDNVELYTRDATILEKPYDLVMTFDASDLKHAGNEMIPERVPKPYTFICFDHHATNPRFADLNAVLPEASSTCEVVYRFFEANGIRLNDKTATSLLTGLITDTSNFSNPGTNAYAIEAAGRLVAAGARLTDILRNVVQSKSVINLKLWGLALERLQFQPKFDLAYTYFLLSDLRGNARPDEAVEGMANFLNATCGQADTILVLREKDDGTVKGSLRSHERDISVLAKLLGGGGHKKAAGFTIKEKIEEILSTLST